MSAFTLTLTLSVVVVWWLSSGRTLVGGCIPSDSRGGRPSDGKLKCYRCNTDEKPLCSLGKWKFANQSVRRRMEEQCPRKVSSFCYLKLAQNRSGFTQRGCFRNEFQGKIKASVGCINMGRDFRVCLCAHNLCNAAPSTTLPHYSPLVLLLFTTITSNYYRSL